MAASPDVLVIGGGVIGLTAAYELASAGLHVEVCDRSDLGREASWAGAGIIPPGNFARAATPLDRLRAFSSNRFPSFTQHLADFTGIDSAYRLSGGIELLDPEDENCAALWQDEGIASEQLNGDEIRNRFPDSAMTTLAYFLPGMAQVRNPRLLKALIQGCQQLGVTLRTHCGVELLNIVSNRIDSVSFSNGDRQRAAHYLIAAGAWSQRMLTQLHCKLEVHPVRGQIVLYRAKPADLEPILLHGKRYLVPRGDGCVLAGSTEEPEAGFNTSSTPEGVAELRSFAEALVPALRSAVVAKTWAGLRPAVRGRLPFIGAVPGSDNCLAAVGHFRSGIQLSLGTATMLADRILKRESVLDPTAFRLDRPDGPSPKPAFRS